MQIFGGAANNETPYYWPSGSVWKTSDLYNAGLLQLSKHEWEEKPDPPPPDSPISVTFPRTVTPPPPVENSKSTSRSRTKCPNSPLTPPPPSYQLPPTTMSLPKTATNGGSLAGVAKVETLTPPKRALLPPHRGQEEPWVSSDPLHPEGSCNCHNAHGLVTAVGLDDRKGIQNLHYFKYYSIQNWVNTGSQNFQKLVQQEKEILSINRVANHPVCHPIADNGESCLPPCQKIGKFLPNKKALILPLRVANIKVFSIMDCGASFTICSSSWLADNIDPFFSNLLQPYDGPPLHSCENRSLQILGSYMATIEIGPLKTKHSIVVYMSSLSELLIGLDLIKRFGLIISQDCLYIPVASLLEANNQVLRIQEQNIQSLSVFSDENIIVQPYSNVNLSVFVDQQHINPLQVSNLHSHSIIISSEELQPDRSLENINIAFQMVQFENFKSSVLFCNLSDLPITLAKGEEVGLAENMAAVTPAEMAICSNTIAANIYQSMMQIPHHRSLHELEQNLFWDADINSVDEKPIPWEELKCPDNIPGLKPRLIKLCQKFESIYGRHKFDVGSIIMASSHSKLDFSVESGCSPVNQQQIRTHPSLLQGARKFLQKLMDRNLLKFAPANCPWSSPLFFLRKNTSAEASPAEAPERAPEVRAICDLRGLNSKLRPSSSSSFPVMPCRDILNQMRGQSFVSKLDFIMGYWQVTVSDKSQRLQALNFQGCHFVPRKLLHGLMMAMNLFSRLVTKILIRDNLDPFVNLYCDDMVIATTSLDQHIVVLERLFTTLQKANVKIHFHKQNLCHNNKIKLFGYILSLPQQEISPDPEKFREIENLPRPHSRKSARRFAGLFAMWTSLIPKLAKILSPIYGLCSDKTPFKWSQNHEEAWLQAKALLSQQFAVSLPDPTKPYIMCSDAARKLGCSHTVFQRSDQGILKPITHYSKTFKGSEIFFSQAKAELYSLVIGLNNNIIYFCMAPAGRHLILTDCISLQYCARFCFQNSQLFNWSTFIFSLPVRIVPLAASSPLIRWSDVFSRPEEAHRALQRHLQVFNDKKFDFEKFARMDFFGLPSLSIQDIFHVFKKFDQILEKHSTGAIQKAWASLKDCEFPDRPQQHIHLNQASVLHIQYAKDPFQAGSQGLIRHIGQPIPKEALGPLLSKNQSVFQIKEILNSHFPALTLDKIRSLQAEDPLCKKFLPIPKLPFFLVDGLLFKRTPCTCVLVWPKVLTLQLLGNLHAFNGIYHLKDRKLRMLVKPLFLVQGFSQALSIIKDNCKICILHTKRPIPQKPNFGPSILVSHPLQFLSFDFIILNSSFKRYPALLTVCDVFSNCTWWFPARDQMTSSDFISFFFISCHPHHWGAKCNQS